MNDDDVIRLVLLGFLVVFMPFGAYHRFRSNTGEKLDRWQEGLVILLGLRLNGVAFSAAAAAWMINPAWMTWSAMPLPGWLRWAGVAVAGCGGVLLVWTFHNLGRNLTDTVVTRKEHSLVTTGPYRWVRHPFYGSCLLGVLGTSAAMANWLLLVLAGIGLVLIAVRTRIEEQKLIERFGDDYRRYMAATGRFVPRIAAVVRR
jgi:protein-S-isoprenylcysteine O-methyltransferase Ste14